LFPVELFDALAVEDEELLAVDVVEPVEGAWVDGLELVWVVSSDDCNDTRDTVLDEELEADALELPLVEEDWDEL
jgi:hypothetical protein